MNNNENANLTEPTNLGAVVTVETPQGTFEAIRASRELDFPWMIVDADNEPWVYWIDLIEAGPVTITRS